MEAYHSYAVVVPNDDKEMGGFIARCGVRHADDKDGNVGYGETPLAALACRCAIQDQSETSEEQDWHLPFTTPRAQPPLAGDVSTRA